MAFVPWAKASIVYAYDFPGTPGSGLAVDQTSTQPGHATFSDFTRVGGIQELPTANVFDSNFWPTGSFFDSGVYATFTLTADSSYTFSLSQITFDEMRASGGPTKGRVSIFVDGSTTPYATFNYNPGASVQNKLFDFTDITGASTVEFRFYGWNGGTASAGLLFDNVSLTVLSIVPEFEPGWVGLLVIALSLLVERQRTRQKAKSDAGGFYTGRR